MMMKTLAPSLYLLFFIIILTALPCVAVVFAFSLHHQELTSMQWANQFISTHPAALLNNVLQVLTIITAYSIEKNYSVKYGKFASDLKDGFWNEAIIPSKMGMLIIYTPSLVVSFFLGCGIVSDVFDIMIPSPTLASWMLFVHFMKRELEILFLHKYSGNTLLNVASFIAFYYAFTSFLISLVATTEPSVPCRFVGRCLFLIGVAGNFYHHYLLSQLRKISEKGKMGYVPPSGGLFEYVASPHYLFELVTWLGIAVASHSLTGYLNFVSMSCYLAARSSNSNEWNRKNFSEKDWPRSRNNLIPFIF